MPKIAFKFVYGYGVLALVIETCNLTPQLLATLVPYLIMAWRKPRRGQDIRRPHPSGSSERE